MTARRTRLVRVPDLHVFRRVIAALCPDAELVVCYVMNRMEAGVVGDLRGANIVAATIEGLAA